MNTEEKNIKICEFIGWRIREGEGVSTYKIIAPDDAFWYASSIDGQLPNHFTDLNACHEMEGALAGMSKAEFAVQLSRVCGREWPGGIGAGSFAHIHATAAQRAEAFGLTLNLWKQGE